MGESNARRLRRQKEQQQARQAALQDAPAEATLRAAPDSSPTATSDSWEPDEVNFMLTPGGLLQPEDAPPLVRKAKTVRVPGPLNVHVGGFDARHMGRFNFERSTLALWRVLLREEHRALEVARHETEVTGVPAQPKMGQLYKALRDELELMRREESGEIFDEE
ncbi:hypothetical protein OG497_38000 [Streptomyces sp. NBC_01242]|uniref:hypothetical protein n=1 Tax=Streptomyces sp. NBC_01242 TaxID=2903795 RepID=UPI0022568537|nr:hypothetical protein [Streptomyces sp. NBC_01242]MCX4799653.1 hypothetical protein [Streptomyces sp. NBC_01242]